ncbi:hypothetical protein ACFLRU_01195 [Bacteroidota bacterium]
MKEKQFTIGFLLFLILILFFLKNEQYLNFNTPKKNNYVQIENSTGESCVACHKNTKGYSDYHNPKLIGCVACHLGNPDFFEKEKSHQGMVIIPGNLSDAPKTCGKCHPNELLKIENSLMTTNSGLVAVDKFIFGEADSPDYHYHIKEIKKTASDKHIRDLCANCHLGAQKNNFGEITQMSRGGGCNACHLNYSEAAKTDLDTYISSNKTKLPEVHPSTDIYVTNEHCFGCHSRSSRISTNFEGLQETVFEEEDIRGNNDYKVLEDKRVYAYKEEDVHHTKGMLCIDCHSSHEVMGNGKKYSHEEQAVKVQCSDCHFKEQPNTIPYDSLDQESILVFLHRKYTHSDKPIIAVKKDKHPLVNTFVDSLGNAFLISKKDNVIHPMKPQSKICSRDNAHKNVACSTCHSSWTSRCIGCHNEFDKDEAKGYDLLDKKYGKGQWKEYVAEFSSSLPTMGVRELKEGKSIEPAIPGMILTIDKGSYAGKEPGKEVSFHRLYAPNSPHTTTKNVRDCKSCHANSIALGYGKGTMKYIIRNGKGKWNFISEYANNPNDNLPEDAWIPFLKELDKNVVNSTRTDFRPFSVKEQKQLLLVGSCLECHNDNSKTMQQSLIHGLNSQLQNLSNNCILPNWD